MTQKEKLIELMAESPITSLISYESTLEFVDYLIGNNLVVLPCRCCECICWDSDNISCEGSAKCLIGEGGIRYRNKSDFCSHAKRKGGN